MKKLALLICLAALAALPVLAADPVIVVNSANNVTVDGNSAGSIVDVLANSTVPNIRARVLDAWLVYEKGVFAKEKARADAAIAKAQADVQAVNDAKLAELAKFIAALQKQVRDLGGTPVTP